MSPVKTTSISVDEVEEMDLKKDLQASRKLRHGIVYVCHSEGEWARQKI
jgi:hypothetical protein